LSKDIRSLISGNVVHGLLIGTKSVTLNDLEWRNSPYFALVHRIFVYDVVAKQLLGLPRFQNLLFSQNDLHNYSAIIWAKQTDNSV